MEDKNTILIIKNIIILKQKKISFCNKIQFSSSNLNSNLVDIQIVEISRDIQIVSTDQWRSLSPNQIMAIGNREVGYLILTRRETGIEKKICVFYQD